MNYPQNTKPEEIFIPEKKELAMSTLFLIDIVASALFSAAYLGYKYFYQAAHEKHRYRKLDILREAAEHTRLEAYGLSPDELYSEAEIFKNFTYLQDRPSHARLAATMMDNLIRTEDYRLKLLLGTMASCFLNRESSAPDGKGYDIFVSWGRDIDSLCYRDDGDYDSKNWGKFLKKFRAVVISNMENEEKSAALFVHECFHMLYAEAILPQNKLKSHWGGKYLLPAYQAFKENLKRAETEPPECEHPVDPVLQFLKKVYNNIAFAGRKRMHFLTVRGQLAFAANHREEMAANIIEILLYGERHKDQKAQLFAIAAPLIQYFDIRIRPYLENYLANHPKREFIRFSDDFKRRLEASTTRKQKAPPGFFHAGKNLSPRQKNEKTTFSFEA